VLPSCFACPALAFLSLPYVYRRMSVKGNWERESTSAKNKVRGSAKVLRQKREILGPKQSASAQSRRVPSESEKAQARRQKDLSIMYNQCVGEVSYALEV
jgi:hypothetical protein